MAKKKKKNSIVGSFGSGDFGDWSLPDGFWRSVFIISLAIAGVLALLGLFGTAGLVGQWLSSRFLILFGWGRFYMPLLMIVWAYLLFDEERFSIRWLNYIGFWSLLFSLQTLMMILIDQATWPLALLSGNGGGQIGFYLASIFLKLFGVLAGFLIALAWLLVSSMFAFDTNLHNMIGPDSYFAKLLSPFFWLWAKIRGHDHDDEENREDDDSEEEGEEEHNEDGEDEEEGEESEDSEEEGEEEHNEDGEDEEEEEENEEDEPKDEKKKTKNAKNKKPEPVTPISSEPWWKTPLNLVIQFPSSLLDAKKGKASSGDIKEKKETIRHSLENFGISAEMGDVSVGPTVTQFTLKPADGIKLSRIANLSDNLALALAAHPIRIEAPIPGKSLVGVEVPNEIKAMVSLKELIVSRDFADRKNDLMMALGRDVAGKIWLADLTKMPHLLVAGATGSGKSVCLNTIIVSLMYQNTPDSLRFIMVDPKQVEMTPYQDIPYLLSPVVTDTQAAVAALHWCIEEMENRYTVLKNAGKRNIGDYNAKAKVKMPYIVFVIDELADLMLLARKEVESAVIRLTQKSRAVGIHLILATQRPSVDVITGLIKANMPARIAFSVVSSTDSRTILDTLGAEKLLGRGDMLFTNAEMSKPVRIQGAFLSDPEISRVTKYAKAKGEPEYVETVTEQRQVGEMDMNGNGSKGSGDSLYYEVKQFVVQSRKASTSLLQRRFSIGYGRAAKLIDVLESNGVIGPSNGSSKPREVLISPEQMSAVEDEEVSGVILHKRGEAKSSNNYLGEAPDSSTVFYKKKEDEDDEEDNDDEEHEDDIEEDVEGNEDNEEESRDEEDENEELGDEEENDEDEDEEKPAKKKKSNVDDELYFSR